MRKEGRVDVCFVLTGMPQSRMTMIVSVCVCVCVCACACARPFVVDLCVCVYVYDSLQSTFRAGVRACSCRVSFQFCGLDMIALFSPLETDSLYRVRSPFSSLLLHLSVAG